MTKNRQKFRPGVVLGLFLMLLIAAAVGPALAAPDVHAWVGNKFDGNGHEAWDKDGSLYVTGNVDGYSEGETVPFRVSIDGAADAEQLKFLVCLDLDVSATGFGFTEIEPWTTTIATPGAPPALADLTGEVGEFNAANGTIDAVTFLGENVEHDGQNCGDDYLGWLVEFTVTDASQLTYIVYGGKLAASGSTYITAPAGTPQVVPNGMGASAVNGVFQARIQATGSGDKTVNFQGNDIGDPTAISLQGFTGNYVINPQIFVLLGLVIALSVLTMHMWKKVARSV